MIQGNHIWTQALAESTKQPLYALEIPDFAIAITNFTAGQQPSTFVPPNGYGETGHGMVGYGQ